MTATQQWIIRGSGLALLLVVIFPPWQQRYTLEPIPYRGQLGHHLIWRQPQPREVGTSPARQFSVEVNIDTLLTQIVIVMAMTAIMLLRKRLRLLSADSKLLLLSLLLALCLPVPPPDGIPLAALIGLALASPFTDNGHLGPWYAPMLAGVSLAVYFVAVYLLANGVAWLVRRRIRASSS